MGNIFLYIHNLHPVVCLSLPAPNNGIVSYSDPTLGLNTVATYTCETDYILYGDTTRTCESDGNWNGDAPTCEGESTCNGCPCIELYGFPSPVVCPVLTLGNGVIMYDNESRRVGTSATLSCNMGYRLAGESVITCQLVEYNMATWSESSPMCEGVFNKSIVFLC